MNEYSKKVHLVAHARLGTECILYPTEKRRKMNSEVIRGIHLVDTNGENLAEFLVMQTIGYSGNPWVKVIPYFGMHEMYRTDISNPIALQAGMIMPIQSFLGYIAQIANNMRNKNFGYQMRTSAGPDYVQINLVPNMNAADIAKLTGIDVQMVRDFYRDNFVVKVDP
jgi:hypothetical protein